MPRRVGSELEQLSQQTVYAAADQLVFGHPDTGKSYDVSKLRRRFKTALV
jgi:hypothetical protein